MESIKESLGTTEGGLSRGSCLCGAIRFVVNSTLESATACHCRQCRKHSGHFEASAEIPRTALKISGMEKLSWFNSQKARRGFCSVCGSSLFWDPLDRAKHDWTAVALGAFDTPTNTTLEKHIYVAEKGDYYDIADGLPQYDD
ncbi:MAG: GFA family protein [Pseudomonadota bacterium]